MTKRRTKDIQEQLQQEAEMTARQAILIKQLYAERDNLKRQIEILNLALNLMIKLTNICADSTAQWPTKGG